MLDKIKLLIKKVLKKYMLLLFFFKINNKDNNLKEIKKKDNYILSNKIVTNLFIKEYDYKTHKINLLLLSKALKKNNNNNNIFIKNSFNFQKNGIIESKNINFFNYIFNNTNYPNIFLDNKKKKEILKIRKFFLFFCKQDLILQKKYNFSNKYTIVNNQKFSYLKSKFAKRTCYHDREFDKIFKHVNAIVEIKKEPVKRNFIARLLQKQREKIMFFQGRPKIYYFYRLKKLENKKIKELNKKFLIDFKKNTYEKNIYIKNSILNIWRKYIYQGNLYNKKLKYNLTAQKHIRAIYYRKNRDIEVLSLNKLRFIPLEFSVKRFYIKRRSIKGFPIRHKKIRIIISSPKYVYKRPYFGYSKYLYKRYWIKSQKNKIILDKEKIIDSEYNYIDPGLVLLKFKLKNVSLNYEYFDFIATFIQDKGFTMLFYIFIYIPIILCIHYIRKHYFRKDY